MDLQNKSISLIGYGVSNRALLRYLCEKGFCPTVRCEEECDVPSFIPTVFGKGYLDTKEDIVFRSPGVRPEKIKGSGKILTELAFSLDRARSFKIGVSGSDGKTTTVSLIYQMLKQSGKNAFIGGNIGKPVIPFAEKLSEDDFLCCEMSSFQLYDFAPTLDVAAITNISENHLDWHSDMQEYINAKKNILKNAKRAVLNYDDPCVSSLRSQDVTFFSLCDCTHLLGKGQSFVHIVNGNVCYDTRELFSVSQISLKGEFNVQNVLCAIACVYGIANGESCKRVACEFCGVENRMENLGKINGVTFISSAIDTTPARTKATLSAFDMSRSIVIMGGYDKCLSYGILSPQLDGAKGIVLCGENSEKIQNVTKNKKIIKLNTINEAVSVALSMAENGDFVILSPASASFDMFKNYKEKALCFKECVLKERNKLNGAN